MENHKQFDIVCAGIATWDTLFTGIDRDLMSIDGILSKGYTASSGGDAVNAAISTSRLGLRTAVCASLGKDSAAQMVIDELEKAGVDCSYLHQSEHVHTAAPVILIDNQGERHIIRVPDNGNHFFTQDMVSDELMEKTGHLQTTEGNVIHYGFIEKFIEKLGEEYHIKEIAFDRWGATQMVQDLEGMGFTVVPFGQGYKDMSPPTKEFYKLLMEGKIRHGGNPIMRWMSGNVVVDTDPAGNIKWTKAKSPEKIDGIIAAILALDRCICNGNTGSSIYDDPDRGQLVF